MKNLQLWFHNVKTKWIRLHEERKVERRLNQLKFKKTGLLTWSDFRHPWAWILYTFMAIFLTLFVVIAIAPVIWLFISSFKSTAELYAVPYRFWPENFNLVKIAEVWRFLDFNIYFSNSIVVVIGAVICAVLFNGLLAYVISIVKPSGYKVVYALVMLSYMIPAVTSIVPLFKQIAALDLIDSFLPLWLVFGANAFYFIMFKNYFDALPKELFEAAKMDGANNLQIFFSVLIPLARPIIGVVAIFTLTAAWSDFILPYLVLQDGSMHTVMVKIFSIQASIATNPEFGPDKLLVLLMISIIPQVIIFSLFQKQITSTTISSGIKG